MANNFFEFKHFKIEQDVAAMKVGTDSVLLGGWALADGDKRILDIGTGTGILALLLAQTTNGPVHAIEINNEAAQQAKLNFENSKWSRRLNCYNQSIQKYSANCKTKYDLIISNPPYFNEGVRSPEDSRAEARHDNCLTLRELLFAVSKLLAIKGSFYTIIPLNRRKRYIECITELGLWVTREARVKAKANKKVHRILFEIRHEYPQSYQVEEIIIEDSRHVFHQSFKRYTKPYYLESALP